ncbi:MAG: hypothetical protein QXW35_04590 [Candidatus Aenigmatarchaeota archaeon]
MVILQNEEMEKVDEIVHNKLYNYLKKKKLSRKTLRLILKNKYSFVNKINFANKLKNTYNFAISENEISEFYHLRLKSQLWAKGNRKYINSSLEKSLKRLDKVRHSLNYSHDLNEIIIKESSNFLKLIGLNYNCKKYLKAKQILDEYKKWLVLKHYENLDANDPPTIK